MSLTIHALGYTNIGPFQDTRTLRINNGSHLISAPIGSGKSFLFFDGPVYGLYKHSNRNLLNVNQEKGSLSCLFEIHDTLYFVTRSLTQGKSKDRCQSRLFLVTKKHEDLDLPETTISLGTDLENLVSLYTQEEVFKNETDLQFFLQSILPPREVFSNTNFLLQDSDNIFALGPTERLAVFKNVFGLLGIDEAKEILQIHKRDLSTQIKVLSDTDRANTRLQTLLRSFLTLTEKIQSQTGHLNDITELKHIQEDITIRDFSLEASRDSRYTSQKEEIHTHLSQYNTLQEQKKQISLNTQEQKKTLTQIQSSLISNEKETKDVQIFLAGIDKQALVKLQEERKNLREQQQSLLSQRDEHLRKKHNIPLDITDAWQHISHMIADGKHRTTQLTTREEQIIQAKKQDTDRQERLTQRGPDGSKTQELIQREQKNRHSQLLSQQQYLTDKKTQLTQQISQTQQEQIETQQQLTTTQKLYTQQTTFFCRKIDADCPFVQQITAGSISQLEEQITHLTTRLETQKNNITTRTQSLQELATQEKKLSQTLANIQSLTIEHFPDIQETIKKEQEQLSDTSQQELRTNNISQREKERDILKKDIDSMKKVLSVLDRKAIQTAAEKRKEIDSSIRLQEQQEQAMQQKIQQQQEQEKKLAALTATHDQLSQQQQTVLDRLASLTTEQNTLLETEKTLTIDTRKQSETFLSQRYDTYRDLQKLISDHKQSQQDLQRLTHELSLTKDLTDIFTRQLLFIVLEQSLPLLSELLNTFLSTIVDYTISLDIVEATKDKLALEARIYDEKGERLVSSLSGGQKVILKLVWMLSVARYTGSRMLFLDETINNLDDDTVGKVASTLADFIKQQDIKFYVVTHSEQIKAMDIWDEMIEL